ncbi:Phosphate-binding protein PstS precursor [Thalassoglobus neptunius]|uniref:Phosphate-binding protein n=1 Tax=Thalassoglobus neptunius TaxID=1938619 RepID=A0A5C5X8H2_9PLAN|nr:PstS family phosphate ABC transporter substrate-binding protein [Thalassoglobus neptunius]TWT58583.1 Phosphate-binding protein PstS precursor [Thalassoglobus neptunius]
MVRMFTVLVCACTLVAMGCGGSGSGEGGSQTSGAGSEIIIDGSSTVAPVSVAVSEEFSIAHRGVRVPVGTSGTGGGFKKFVQGETDINDASRPIKESEIELCKENGIEFLELTVAIDGLTVVVNSENDFCKDLTVEELKKIWEPESKITKWNEVRSDFPEEIIKLFAPDTDSGTFAYFTEVVCGEEGASRSDYQQSADDNFLVTGVSGDKYALGYFGYAYYIENEGALGAVAIADNGGEPVSPNPETIEDGTYTPLSRPLFLYVNKAKLKDATMVEFLQFYLSDEGKDLVKESGYVPLSDKQYEEQRAKLEAAVAEVSGE